MSILLYFSLTLILIAVISGISHIVTNSTPNAKKELLTKLHSIKTHPQLIERALLTLNNNRIILNSNHSQLELESFLNQLNTKPKQLTGTIWLINNKILTKVADSDKQTTWRVDNRWY